MKGAVVMDKERLEKMHDGEENLPEDKKSDVSHISSFQKLQRGVTGIFVRAGLGTVKAFAAVLLGLIKSVKFICSEMWAFISALIGGFIWLVKAIAAPFRKRMKLTAEMQKTLIKAKKEGGKEYAKAVIRCVGSYLFGEEGVCYTAFNYILPIVSAAFFIGIVSYGSGLEYGISVEYNGKEIGIITAQAEYDEAEREVQQRISYAYGDEPVDMSAKFSLRIISEDDTIMNSTQLANEMLAASDEELTEAFGIYIDGEFIGAVKDKEPIQTALDDRLKNYKVDGTVYDVSYKNKIEYSEGIYLRDSVMTEEEATELLTSVKRKNGVYVAQTGDSPSVVCQKYNMELEEFLKLNPSAEEGFEAGQILNVIENESYLPIQYVREMETLTFLDYETIEVETSSLNVGTSSILVKGERGEKRSNVEITYVDGIERSTKIVSSEITKEPVVEQIGIGTYTAKPASSATQLYGTGQFGWPVNGGYISDTFISDRNHKGLDIAAPEGTDIYAGSDGVVVAAGWNSGGYGYFVMIDHLDGYQTVYAHMSAVYAIEGQTVTRGQLIGAVGSTGRSTGNHLHFEVRYMGMCYDPAAFLNTMNYEE